MLLCQFSPKCLKHKVGESINKNNPKVAVEETGGGEIQVDIKSGECQ